jgi:hypothetical protein
MTDHEHDWVRVGEIGNMRVCVVCGEPGWWFPDDEEEAS